MTPVFQRRPEETVTNPARFYASPGEILADKGLTVEQKAAALKNWEMDQKALSVVETEGTAPSGDIISSGEILREILLTEQELEEEPPETLTAREAVGTFYDIENLQAATDELQSSGFMRQELSVLADERVIRKKLGRLYQSMEEAADDPAAPRSVFISQETMGTAEGAVIGLPLYTAATAAGGLAIATGSTILEIILAAITAGGAGAGIGTILAMLIAKNHARELQQQIDKGGLLLWVNLRSPEKEKLACKILKKYAAHDVHVHEITL